MTRAEFAKRVCVFVTSFEYKTEPRSDGQMSMADYGDYLNQFPRQWEHGAFLPLEEKPSPPPDTGGIAKKGL